jgi:hypothetical protein
VSGGLEPYFYFVRRVGAGVDFPQQRLEPVSVVGDGKHIGQYLAFRTDDEAIVLVLSHIDSYANHNDTSREKNMMLLPQDTLPCNLVLHKPSGGI